MTPTPFLGKIAVIRSEYQALKIGDNLKESVEQQDLPEIWLVFEKENGESQRVELNDIFKEKLAVTGRLLFNYQYTIKILKIPTKDLALLTINP